MISKKRNNTKLCRVGASGRPPQISLWKGLATDRRDLGLGRRAEFNKENILLVIEKRLQGRLDQVLGREVNTQGIDVLLVLIELEMEMRAGCSAGGSDITDDLPLCNSGAAAHPIGKPLQMSVTCCICRMVVDFDCLTVKTVPVSECDYAITDCPNWGAPFRGEVHSRMRHVHFKDGMKAGVSKLRSDVGEFQREPEEGASQASSL